MRIVALETLHPGIQPNVTMIVLRSEDGDVGLGEAFFTPSAVDAYLHDVVAPALFALDCVTPERAAKHLAPYIGYQAGGVETRALGAVDTALWDLLGQRAQLPIVALLRGPAQSSVPVYNTCAGTRLVANSSRQEPRNWGLESQTSLEDLDGFLTRPGALARELESEGIGGMKVWPLSRGRTCSAREIIAEVECALATSSSRRFCHRSDRSAAPVATQVMPWRPQ